MAALLQMYMNGQSTFKDEHVGNLCGSLCHQYMDVHELCCIQDNMEVKKKSELQQGHFQYTV